MKEKRRRGRRGKKESRPLGGDDCQKLPLASYADGGSFLLSRQKKGTKEKALASSLAAPRFVGKKLIKARSFLPATLRRSQNKTLLLRFVSF